MIRAAAVSFFAIVLIACPEEHDATRPEPARSGAPLPSFAPSAATSAPSDAGPAHELGVLAQASHATGAIAVDDANVYFIDDRGLVRASKHDGAALTVLRAFAPGDAYTLVAVDASNVFDNVGGLHRTPKSGGASVVIDTADIACLAVDDSAVYAFRLKQAQSWALGGAVARMDKNGGALKTLIAFRTPGFGCMTIDDANVYTLAFAEVLNVSGNGNVTSIPKSGGASHALAKIESGAPIHLAVDDEYVYWVEGPHTIMRAKKTGGERKVLADMDSTCSSVTSTAADASGLYFTCGGDVMHFAKTDKLATTVTTNASADRIALDQESIYWSSSSRIERVAKPRVRP